MCLRKTVTPAGYLPSITRSFGGIRAEAGASGFGLPSIERSFGGGGGA
jgi:hypothetical protein